MKKCFGLLAIIFSFFGCTNSLEIDTALDRPLVTVNSIFNTDSTWQVRVTRSKDILDDLLGAYYFPIENAQLVLEDDQGIRLDSLTFSFLDGTYIGTNKPEIGKLYNLIVKVEGEDLVSAVNIIPEPVPISSVEIDSSAVVAGADKVKIAITFSDPKAVDNFYSVKILRHAFTTTANGIDRFIDDISFEPLDPASQEYFSSGVSTVFNDKLFQGSEYSFQLSVGTDAREGETEYYEILLLSVSEDYYNYFTTKNLQDSMREDPFAQPVQIHNNILNGLGIFAGFSSSRYQL